MKKYFASALAIAMIALVPSTQALAQDKVEKAEKEKSKNKLSEYDEIIIKQKEVDKNGKVTVEIKDGQVTVNGKPIEEYDDENISVRKRNATRIIRSTPASPFRGQANTWSFDVDGDGLNDREIAFLGVSSNESEGGAKVISVTDNSAAEKAGLKEGDVITKVNDKTVSNPAELSEVISNLKPEEKATISYKRDGKANSASVTLGKRKVMGFANGGVVAPRVHVNPHLEDLNFEFHNDNMNRVFNYGGRPRIGLKAQDTEDGKGVKVIDVDEGSAAEKAGIKEDDIITEFEGKAVNSADELAVASREAKDKSSMKVKLLRNGKSQDIEVKIPKKLKTANL